MLKNLISFVRVYVKPFLKKEHGMKRYIPLFLLLAAVTTLNNAITAPTHPYEVKSKTYFSVPQMYQPATPEYSAFFDGQKAKDGVGGSFDAAGFFAKSTNYKQLGRYFSPHGSDSITVATIEGADVDVLADYLGIASDGFKSTIVLKPEYTTYGFGLRYKQDLGDTFFFDISAPITYVAAEIKLNETIATTGTIVTATATASSVEAAFKQENWTYGKIDGKQTKWGIGDVVFNVGWKYKDIEDPNYLESYVGVLIPVGNKPEAKYMFEPVVGHGGHFGILAGGHAKLQIWEDEKGDSSLAFKADSKGQYLFARTQKRSFDLRGKPWSRYMKYYASEADVLTGTYKDGINYLTKDVKVTPRMSVAGNCAFVYVNEGFDCELGFGILARQAEKVVLSGTYDDTIGIASLAGAITDNTGAISPASTIDKEFASKTSGEYPQEMLLSSATVKEADLDLCSAAHPAIIKCNTSLALGYRWDDQDYPCIVGLGGAFDFGLDNTVMNKWSLWGKFGFSF
jgi:hypothetical protein